MSAIFLIAGRELAAYLRTMSGYVIMAGMLAVDALLFNIWAVPGPGRRSAEILGDFFTLTSGITMIGAIFLSMRLLAEERQTGTIQLLYASPVRDREVVLGKFLSAVGFLCLFFLATLSMPALVAIHGKVSLGHIACGYLGLLLVGCASLSVGTFGSALTRSQVLAAVLSGVMCLALTTAWLLARVTERPLTDAINALAWWPHFEPFKAGLLHLKHVVYFVLVTVVGLFAATRVLEARRWS